MDNIINPYIAGAPITEQRMFFGREDVFDWIEKSLSGQYADHILVVHGQRRVGKTSVLKQLGNRLPGKYVPVFFDLQGRTHTTLDHFLWWLARETVRVLKQDHGLEAPIPEKEDFARDPEYFENTFLPGLQPLMGETCLLYTFDEFDNLEESDVKEELARPLTDYLRRLMGRGEMNFIFSIGSSGRKLENMQAAYTEFFKTALYKKISFLSEEQTHGLVTRPVEGVIEYQRAAVERIYGITSGHPYFTQLTCHELFARCQRTEQRKIAAADVEAVLDDVVERGTVNLKFVWDEASDIEKWSLAALAHLDKADNRLLTDFLRKQRVRFSESDLTSGLLHLREKDVLTKENHFVIQLLRLWLQKNRPIEQVREELTEANPIASRFIEIGLEFLSGGQHDKAIEYFRQALSISADNLQAQINIALAYEARGQLEQAVVEFEKALVIDDEDVAARAGLCDAHLALGDTAMKKSRVKDAVLSYQRVLAINAEHLEARQRMAELSCQQAEKALTGGRDEEALTAFTEALKYTPEDASLLARVEKVREQKKAKVLAAQVARSEKEAAAGNWNKAIAALNEALETAPGEASILGKIESIKAQQLQERLDDLLTKVDTAEKTSRWDAAIAGLNEYMRLKPQDAGIQKRLANLVEAKHAAWLESVMARVDQAVADQSWDAALSALNEALRLEPDNAEMQTKAVEVQEARRSAELNLMLTRADQAASAGRWDEAINVLNDGLASYPGNETLQVKLAEARKAKREARLQAALRLADSAAQSGKWEAAVASLNEVLANEPDNSEFQKKLAEVRLREHESRLDERRAQAQVLVMTEQFGQALEVWQEYLSLHPEDSQRVEEEIKQVTQARELLELYTKAEAAIAARDFDGAIRLLKEIIIRDENYKDASRLLTKAIESRRTAPNQKQDKSRHKPERLPKPRSRGEPKTGGRRIWIGGLLAILILGIGGGLFWLGKNYLPAISGLFTNDTATLTPEPRIINPDLYVYINQESTWHAARDFCAAAGGYLVTIQDAEENKFISQLTNVDIWLGATDEFEEGTWVWVSSEAFEYTSENPFQTDEGRDEDYLMLLGRESPGSWDDQPAEKAVPFVCEWDPFPQGKTIIVTSAEDSGAGTLRQALLDAQAGDTITFDPEIFPPDEPTTIFLTSVPQNIAALPRISKGGITIDASNAGVILDGSKLQEDPPCGLVINSDHNTVMGLLINQFGCAIYLEGGSYNRIGGDRSIGAGPVGQGNLISNNYTGISLLSMAGGNVIIGNLIGTDKSGSEPLGNWVFGIYIEDNQSYNPAPNIIGPDNVIAYNGGRDVASGVITGGIVMDMADTALTITGNSIFDNAGPGIFYNLDDAMRTKYATPPVILYFDLDSGVANGQACIDCIVEIFSTDTVEGKVFEGTVTADEYGNFSFRKGAPLSGPYLTATMTLVPDGNTSEFSQPTSAISAIQIALDAIQNEAPVYQTGFDTWDFGDPVGNARIENGKLIVTSENMDDIPLVNVSNLNSDRYAVEYEFRILEFVSPENMCGSNYQNNYGFGEESWKLIFTGFNSLGQATLGYYKYPDQFPLIADVQTAVDTSETNTVTLIILGDQITAFLNGQFLYQAQNPVGSAIHTQQQFAAAGQNNCEFDNYKLWDLSGVDFSASETTSLFFGSALASITNKTPDFEDDFSNLASGWPTDRNSTGNEYGYQDGGYFISANNICYGPGLPTNPVFSDFVLEMDVRFINQGDGMVSILFRDNSTASYGANLSPSGWFNFHKNVNGIHIPLLETEVPASSFQAWDTPKHLTLIARQNRMATYVNGDLIIAQADTSSSQGWFNFAVCSNDPLQVLIDNLKIWDIADLSP